MITTALDELPHRADVVIIGSGAAGLVAANRAAAPGRRIVVLEKASRVGGTTAAGGGVMWIPASRLGREAGFDDSSDDAAAYLSAASDDRMSPEEIEWYVEHSNEAAEWLLAETRVRLRPLARPDYRLDCPGAARGGRSLDNDAFEVGDIEGMRDVIRPSSYFPLLTMAERDELNGAAPDLGLLEQRVRDGVRTMGGALIASLLATAIDRDVSVAVSARVTSLSRSSSGWQVGVGDRSIDAHAVVIASGGFEWSDQLQRAFLPHPITPISAPSNEGDGLLLGLSLGAAVSEMTSFWGVPVITPPGQTYDGMPSGRMANVEMTLPGSITIAADGRRFVNEALNYADAARVFGAFDGQSLSHKGASAWLVFDRKYLDAYSVAGCVPGRPEEWMISAGTVPELAARLGVPSDALVEQVERFNASAKRGEDVEFFRGQAEQDRFLGDANELPNPCVRPLDAGPFYAVALHCGALGTSGGLATDDNARVLRFDGTPLKGLYAAGNVAATVFRGAYPGGGATLGAAVTRGFVAGAHIDEALGSPRAVVSTGGQL